MKTSMQPIIVKKKKVMAAGHHGGSWKVAFADFATAMMAFFLLMWLIASANDPQKKAIAGYFNDVAGGLVGPGGANSGIVQFDHPQSQPDPMTPPTIRPNEPGGENVQNQGAGAGETTPVQMTDQQIRDEYEKKEKESLAQLKQQLEQELQKNDSPFKELKDQILIDYTALGLRIQIVDKEQRPMFDSGKAGLKDYSRDVLEALAPLLNGVPNHISITGHTDATSYGSGAIYSNWELSADRANSARRSIVDGGYPEEKVVTVQGMGASAPYKPESPNDPINRRIAIIVLKKSVEDALLGKQGVSSDHVIESEGKALSPEGGDPAIAPTPAAQPGAEVIPAIGAPESIAPVPPAQAAPTSSP